MKFLFHDINKESDSGKSKTKEEMGVLKVEVPHWTAEVQIFDDSFKKVADIGKIKSDSNSKSGYSTDTTLVPGVYQIQTSLEGKTESEWFPVSEGKVTQVSHEVWDNLNFTSSVPVERNVAFKGKKNRRTPADKLYDKHLKAAQEWSANLTWSDSQGNSGLFLFLRATENEQIEERFNEGLQLFNTKGELVTDFSEDTVKKDKKAGWLAFNAKLPAGSYVLRRGRSGVRLRHQIIHLCENWQTQVFVRSHRFPSLKTWSVGMGRWGFSRYHDETSTAAEAILNTLRQGSSFQNLFNNEMIEQSLNILLDEKFGNPWLGVLVAYAILKLQEEVEENRKNDFREYFSIFTEKLMPFLTMEIPTHPDV